jgi:hypothetical protein
MRPGWIVGALLLLLAISVAWNILLYRQASRPLYAEGDRALIDRTVARAVAAAQTNAGDIREQSFPIVLHLADRTCVELRRHDGRGHEGACYDRRDRLIEETASVVN